MLSFREQLIHYGKNRPRSAGSHASQISCSSQPAFTFIAIDWIVKQEHRFAGIYLLFLQCAAATLLWLGYQKDKLNVWSCKTNLRNFKHTPSVLHMWRSLLWLQVLDKLPVQAKKKNHILNSVIIWYCGTHDSFIQPFVTTALKQDHSFHNNWLLLSSKTNFLVQSKRGISTSAN